MAASNYMIKTILSDQKVPAAPPLVPHTKKKLFVWIWKRRGRKWETFECLPKPIRHQSSSTQPEVWSLGRHIQADKGKTSSPLFKLHLTFSLILHFHLPSWNSQKINSSSTKNRLQPAFPFLQSWLSNWPTLLYFHFKLQLYCFLFSQIRPYISHYPSLHPAIMLCFLVLSILSIFLSHAPFFRHAPLSFPTLWFSPWLVAGLENRPHAKADASIFGHADRTKGRGSHTILLQIPSYSSFSSIHPLFPFLCHHFSPGSSSLSASF